MQVVAALKTVGKVYKVYKTVKTVYKVVRILFSYNYCIPRC